LLTVADLLEGLDVRLLAGAAALELPVRWVHMSELTDPTPWLSGGEVLLTTGMQLDSPGEQEAFIARLADHQLAALGFGTGFAHETVPEAIVAAAAQRDFPVFEVPYDLPFIAITEAAFSRLVNEQYAVLRRALAAQERLERIVLSQRGLDALAGALSTLIGAAVLVFDPRGELLVKHAFRRTLEPSLLEQLRDELRERGRRREGRAFMPQVDDGGRALALPVAAEGVAVSPNAGRVPEAWLVSIKDGAPLSDFDRLTLHQAVTIVALELLRGRVAGDTERRLAGDLLAGLVRDELRGPELARRLGPFGLGERVAAIVLARDDEARSAAELELALAAALREQAVATLVASVGPLTCALVPGLAEEDLFPLAEGVLERVNEDLPGGVRGGVGRPVDAGDARRSFHEARCALEALSFAAVSGAEGTANGNGSGPAPGRRLATYRELGTFQLLLSLQDDEALRLFCDSILGPIEQSEGHYGGELMRSLEAFIEENGQWERAARRLYCHRHTLRYRIRRVEQLTGRNLGSARDRIEFWLALRGRELVR
jgi:purine catabolism regulator